MPNWCSNTIEIRGPAEKIQALWQSAQNDQLLAAMAPLGEWSYDRALELWGTKWDLSLVGMELVESEPGEAMITGWADSAWSPPVNAFQSYARANTDCYLELKYFEPGLEFTGVWDSEGSDMCWDNVSTLLETTEQEDPVLYELLDYFNIWDWFEEQEELDDW